MKSTISILVIEDRANHIADCKAMIETERTRLPIQVNVLWANNLEEALSLLDQADAVMTDVFFPSISGGNDEEPSGQKVVEQCLAKCMPVVWVTSTYHHGKKTNSVNGWGREHGLEMFDCRDGGDPYANVEGTHKPWKDAFYGLLGLIVALEEEFCVFCDGKIMRKSWGDEYDAHDCAGHLSYYLLSGADPKESGDSIMIPVLEKMKAMGFPKD